MLRIGRIRFRSRSRQNCRVNYLYHDYVQDYGWGWNHNHFYPWPSWPDDLCSWLYHGVTNITDLLYATYGLHKWKWVLYRAPRKALNCNLVDTELKNLGWFCILNMWHGTTFAFTLFDVISFPLLNIHLSTKFIHKLQTYITVWSSTHQHYGVSTPNLKLVKYY